MIVWCDSYECKYCEEGQCKAEVIYIDEDQDCREFESYLDEKEWQTPFWKRMLDDGRTLEVVRLCSDGTKDVCSFLYSRAARIAKEMGYHKIITYILESESGASLKAAGWHQEATTSGGHWSRPSRPRSTTAPTVPKKRYSKILRNDTE